MRPDATAAAPRLILFAVAAVPALSGYPLDLLQAQWLAGQTYGWLIYGFAVNLLIWGLLGSRVLADVVTVAALIAAPVVFGGAVVSTLGYLLGMGGPPATFGSHYVALAITILTVVPLALAIVAAIPFHRMELQLLTGTGRIRRIQKVFLMALRVFNHIVHGVIPLLLEVVREEGHLAIGDRGATNADTDRKGGGPGRRLRTMGRTLTQMGVAAICLAVQYIPLWAMEIAALPESSRPGDHPPGSSRPGRDPGRR